MAVVIEIDDARAPADEARLNSDARRARHILKIRLPIVAIQSVGIFGKVRLEKIDVPIQIVIADADAHPRLFLPSSLSATPRITPSSRNVPS